jgi:orotidine-5'-phosphate decarboxylase
MTAIEKYERRVDATNSLLCVGLDSHMERIPPRFSQEDPDTPQFAFNRWIIEQTHSFTSAYKPNMAFYEAAGEPGIRALRMTMDYLRENHADILTICDAKRADIGSTSEAYAQAIFDEMGFDAVTLQPYLGKEALEPFLGRADKGCIILCRTSNPGAGELQDLLVEGKPLWQVVAERVQKNWNENGNCMLVVGATYPEELAQVRRLVGEMTLLVPGIGTQGGDIKQVTQAGANQAGGGIIMNMSRGIIFAENPAEAAREIRDEINRFRA